MVPCRTAFMARSDMCCFASRHFQQLQLDSRSHLACPPRLQVLQILNAVCMCMQLKSNRAFQLALGARTSLDHALDDVIDQGLKKRSAAALQAVTSAYVGAKGAVLVSSCNKKEHQIQMPFKQPFKAAPMLQLHCKATAAA